MNPACPGSRPAIAAAWLTPGRRRRPAGREAATTGRRGPGQPGSGRVFPGESSSPAAAFGPGMALDVLPGCAGLAVAADATAGDDDRFADVSEGELAGVVCAWDRIEAHAAARNGGPGNHRSHLILTCARWRRS